MQGLPARLDPLSQYLINHLKDQLTDAKDQLKEAISDNKKLANEKSQVEKQFVKENAALEKKLDEATRSLGENPKGFAG